MQKLVIFGATDFAQVAKVYFSTDGRYDVAAFVVHREYLKEPALLGLPVVAFEEVAERYPPGQYGMFVAVGFKEMNQAREKMYRQAKDQGYRLISFVHPRAAVAAEVTYGDNCFIFEHNTLQPFAKIGNDVIVWSGNHIGHHAQIGDHCFISSHCVISGHVEIGSHCFLGVNSSIRDGVRVGDRCLIGAGALILENAPADGVYAAKGTERHRVPSSKIKL